MNYNLNSNDMVCAIAKVRDDKLRALLDSLYAIIANELRDYYGLD